MRVDLAPTRSEQLDAGQTTYGMANLRSERTGLPFIVFISQKDDARYAARLKVSPAPKVNADTMGSYAIEPFEFKAGWRLSSSEERQLGRWIDVNRPVLRDYWDGVIEYTEDALARLTSI